MKIETRDGKLVVAEHYSGLDALKEERGFAASTAALGVFIFVASMGVLLAFGIPATTVFSWATLQPFVVTSALFGAIAVIGLLWAAVAAPFDCGFEFVFDTTSKICSYKRILHLRRWNIDLRGPAENLAFAQISGVGVREFCDEGSYLYQPVLLVGARTIPLASRRCSYLELESKLETLRRETGLPKRDLEASVLFQSQIDSGSDTRSDGANIGNVRS